MRRLERYLAAIGMPALIAALFLMALPPQADASPMALSPGTIATFAGSATGDGGPTTSASAYAPYVVTPVTPGQGGRVWLTADASTIVRTLNLGSGPVAVSSDLRTGINTPIPISNTGTTTVAVSQLPDAARAMSANGEWVLFNAFGTSYLQNTHTHTTTAIPFPVTDAAAVSDDGNLVGFWSETPGIVGNPLGAPATNGSYRSVYIWNRLTQSVAEIDPGLSTAWDTSASTFPSGVWTYGPASQDLGRLVVLAGSVGEPRLVERSTGRSAAVSAFRATGDDVVAISRDGRWLLRQTGAQLVSEDRGTYTDLYRLDADDLLGGGDGHPVLVSVPTNPDYGDNRGLCIVGDFIPPCHGVQADAGADISDDGNIVAFTSTAVLDPERYTPTRPGQSLAYARDISAGTTTLVGGRPLQGADPITVDTLIGLSSDGSRVVVQDPGRNVLFAPGDSTPPIVTGALGRSANAAGWFDAPVTISWSATDPDPSSGTPTTPHSTMASTEGAGVVYTSAPSCDFAGNCATGTATVSLDVTAPTITGAVVNDDGTPRSPNGDGWYRSAVRVRFNCGDSLSGVADCPSDQVLSLDGAGQSASGTAKDMAGNITSATVAGINIDSSAPQSTVGVSCIGFGGWCRGSSAGVTVTASDTGSGVKEIHYVVGAVESIVAGNAASFAVPLSANSGQAPIAYWAIDQVGNIEQPNLATVKYDDAAPTVTNSVTPAANAAGWSNQNTTVHFSATDDQGGSGVASVSPDVTFSNETAGQTVNGFAGDVAGNLGTDSVVIKLDKTAPSILATASGAHGANGWYVGPVKVHFVCADALSAVATCPADVTLLNDGANQSVSGTATDVAGNTASATATEINLDSKAPTVAFGSHPASYTVDQTVTISCTASDALSGLASSTCQNVSAPASSFLVGGNTLSASATDKAGNIGSASTSFTVTVTPSSLCAVTGRFVIDALQSKYGQSIPPATLMAANKTVTAICSHLPTTIKPAARAGVIAAFTHSIAAATPALLTPTQAATLTRLASSL